MKTPKFLKSTVLAFSLVSSAISPSHADNDAISYEDYIHLGGTLLDLYTNRTGTYGEVGPTARRLVLDDVNFLSDGMQMFLDKKQAPPSSMQQNAEKLTHLLNTQEGFIAGEYNNLPRDEQYAIMTCLLYATSNYINRIAKEALQQGKNKLGKQAAIAYDKLLTEQKNSIGIAYDTTDLYQPSKNAGKAFDIGPQCERSIFPRYGR